MTNLFDDEYIMLDEFRKFSFQHIALGDVDPIYTMIRNSELSDNEKKRLIFSNLMVYDLKHSIKLTSIPDDQYYDYVKMLFTEAKVGKDRIDVASRETNVKSRSYNTQIDKMRCNTPEQWIDNVLQNTVDWNTSIESAKMIPTFGEYFAFKVADMVESIFDMNYTVKWDDSFRRTIPKGSLSGFELVKTGSATKHRSSEQIRQDPLLEQFFLTELEFFKDYKCPHNPTRCIGVTEIETFLCDFRKTFKGTLNKGDKVLKLKSALEFNVGSDIADKLKSSVDNLIDRRAKYIDVNVTENECEKL
jgi:hypothetical protein